MSYKNVKPGDIFIISDIDVNGKKIALTKNIRLGKVIFISKRTRGMVGIIPSVNHFDTVPKNIGDIKFSDKVLYTDWYYLRNGDWQIINHLSVTKGEEDLTSRLIGTGLWRLDECLGVISKPNLKNYRKQSQYGFEIFYSTIDNL